MSSDAPMSGLSNSEDVLYSEDDPESSNDQNPHKLFLLGYIPNARHNPTLKTITNDLLSHYYISWNASKWSDGNGDPSRSRSLMANADALVFFINEQTLRDANCLLTLQYAWSLTLPILMLRPPMTKLVISNHDSLRDHEKILQVGDGAIVRSASAEPWQLLNNGSYDTIDYMLLQDILYEGYRLSTLYDPQEHSKSMSRIRQKLSSIFTNLQLPMSKSASTASSQPHFFLSPSNSSLCDTRKLSPTTTRVVTSSGAAQKTSVSSYRRRPSASSDRQRLNLSQSTGNLRRAGRTPYPTNGKHFQIGFANGRYGDADADADEDNDDDDGDDDGSISIKTRSGRRPHIMKSPPPPERIPSSVAVSENGQAEVEVEDQSLPPPPPEVQNSIQKEKKTLLIQKPPVFKTPTLDLPAESDSNSEYDADNFPLPPPTPMSGLFSIPSGRNSTDRSRAARMNTFGSVTSRTSSLDRRMSLSCLEDMSNYQKTQYLVFPLRDSTKQPYLVRFPEDMHEEEEKHGGSVWGSDTSLEEEIKLAGKINAGIVVDYMDDSPIQSPAPYLGDLG